MGLFPSFTNIADWAPQSRRVAPPRRAGRPFSALLRIIFVIFYIITCNIHNYCNYRKMSKLLLLSVASKPFRTPFSFFRRSALGLGVASLLLGSFSLAQAAQSVSLAWNTDSDPTVVGYNVDYGTSSGNYTQTINVGNSTTATVSSLTAGQTYYFAVTAHNAASQNSIASNQVSFAATATPTRLRRRFLHPLPLRLLPPLRRLNLRLHSYPHSDANT